MMKRALAVILAAGFVVGSYATDARVVVMGRHSAFYRDEVSVFKNPADISLYPDMLYGSYGRIADVGDLSNSNFYSDKLVRPMNPFFGGMVSYRFSEEENGPMFSFGAFLNRRDYVLEKLLEKSAEAMVNNEPNPIGVTPEGTTIYDFYPLKEPVAKLDLIFGYDLGNGIALGLGAYGAHQRISANDKLIDETSIYKGTFGVNWNLEQGLDLEASVNGGRLTGIYGSTNIVSDAEYFYRGDVRFFSAVPSINGSFVPQVSLEFMELAQESIIDLTGGVGVNMNIDRGFFWAGVQGLYTQSEPTGRIGETESSIGARFSFGIERNVITDWFLIRVGGQKEVRNVDAGNGRVTEWVENPQHSGGDDDLVGLGFGLNIDNRLRIDFVASEDLPYTFTNLVSGNKSHLFNRVSATYRF